MNVNRGYAIIICMLFLIFIISAISLFRIETSINYSKKTEFNKTLDSENDNETSINKLLLRIDELEGELNQKVEEYEELNEANSDLLIRLDEKNNQYKMLIEAVNKKMANNNYQVLIGGIIFKQDLSIEQLISKFGDDYYTQDNYDSLNELTAVTYYWDSINVSINNDKITKIDIIDEYENEDILTVGDYKVHIGSLYNETITDIAMFLPQYYTEIADTYGSYFISDNYMLTIEPLNYGNDLAVRVASIIKYDKSSLVD